MFQEISQGATGNRNLVWPNIRTYGFGYNFDVLPTLENNS